MKIAVEHGRVSIVEQAKQLTRWISASVKPAARQRSAMRGMPMRIAEEELPVRPATREIAIISMMTAGIFSSKMLSRSFWNDGKVCTTEVKPTILRRS